jgi:PAS domain S-box-containing protein
MRMRPWETMTPASWSELEGRIPARRKAFLAGDAEAVVEQHEIQQARRDGTLVWTEMITTLVGDAKTGLRVLGVSRDITKRKEAQEALSQQEARLSSLLRALPSGVGIARHRVITEVNDRVCELSGYSREELLGRNTRLFYATDEDCHRARQELYGTVHDRKIGSAECRWKRKYGEIYDVLINSSVLDPADPETITFTVTDISALKLAEARIHTLSQAVEQSPVSVVITDLEGNIEYVNPRFTEVTGYAAEEVLGKNPRILKSGDTPTEVYAQIWSTIQVGGQWRGELKNKKKNGEFCWELASVSPIRDARGEITRFLAVKVDITDSKRLEEQVLRSQRMESIGTLASGVAHDLNNILAPIMLAIDVLREGERSPQDSTMLQMLAQGTQRGAGIVKQLLMFGRGMGGQRATFLPHPVLREMAKVIKETFPKSITLEQRFHQELWPIHADATQIHQVLLNLCVNARDAMPHGGKLTIAAQNLFLDEDYVRKNPDARIGPFVVLQITDTGCGIRPELLEKVFDPFFTTKDLGKGTGLGLSTVLGIVKGHGGFVQIASRVGEGTQFQAYLPAMESGSVQTGTPGLQRLPQGHGELVLIVDDEEAICNIARRMLEKNGYRVLTVQNGAEGLVACSQHRTHVQAVITDMVMPVMDGATLIRVLRDYAPNLKIIAMTGLAPQEEKAFKPVLSADAFLCKPFTPEQLLVTLSKVLTPEPEIVEFPQIEIATSPEDPNALIPAALPSA